MNVGALKKLALYVHPPLVLRHDAIDCCQSKASALADFLCGKERLENAFECGFVHAIARIGDRQAHERSRQNPGFASDALSIDLDWGEF